MQDDQQKPQGASDAQPQREDKSTGFDRRSLLGGIAGAAALGAGGAILPTLAGSESTAQAVPVPGNLNSTDRAGAAYRLRLACARQNFIAPIVPHPTNGDEELYPDRLGSFSKSLPHNQYGEVDPAAYQSLVDACAAGTQLAFESVPSGQPNSSQRLKFHSPLAGIAFDLQGTDGHNLTMRSPPTFASAEEAGEIVENYWMALLRDVPMHRYSTHPLAQQACAELTAMSDFRGPKIGGQVTPQTLFRDSAPGCTTGPYLSQFWWKSQPFGSQYIDPRMRTLLPGTDYMTDNASWLARQNGVKPTAAQALLPFDNTLRYMRTGRDLGRWVHMDVLYQAYFQALLHLMTPPDVNNPFTGGGMGCPHNPGDPYTVTLRQEGFATFGGPYYMTISTEVATRALKATWYQKWFVHRRLRPEAFAGRIHHKLVNGRPYPIHADVLNSSALALIQSQYGGNAFLPQIFPEGCPVHPAYAAGHATVAGACVTILKALFYEQFPFPNPVIPSDDGLTLLPYTGPGANQLTVGGELNKLAMNVAYGRHIAGVHWRSDGYDSLRLGEELAISILRDQRIIYAEEFNGFTFTKFDGTTITI